MHLTVNPGTVGCSMAMLVFPQAEGKAAATNLSFPSKGVTPMIYKQLRFTLCFSKGCGKVSDVKRDNNFETYEHVFGKPPLIPSDVGGNPESEALLCEDAVPSVP